MKTVLFANELGMGFGHINRLLAVAAHLLEHRLVFAVPDRALALSAIEARLGPGVEVTAVAEWRSEEPGRLASEEFQTLADVLFDLGFGEHEIVAAAVRLWQDRLDRLRPDLIVADFAPMLQAASAGKLPTIMVGSGYTIPPALSPLPGMSRNDRSVPTLSARRELTILRNVNVVRDRLASPPLRSLFELFRADQNFPAAFPFYDGYREIRVEPLIQPFNIPRILVGPDFAQRCGPDVFCYLDASHPGVNPILTALNGLPCPSQVFIRGADPLELASHCSRQVGIHRQQADFRTLLPQTRLLIHGGGPGTATAGMMAGVPQLLLPTYLDQELVMSGMEPFGCSVGARIGPRADPSEVSTLIKMLLENYNVQSAALRCAQTFQSGLVEEAEAVVVAACRERLREGAD